MAARLGAIAELAITSGRVRDAYGPGAELALWALFQKTPRGREIAASVAALNAALKPLEGQTIETLNAIARAPGAYALTIKTAQCELVIRFEPAGVRLESLEVGWEVFFLSDFLSGGSRCGFPRARPPLAPRLSPPPT